VGGTQAALGDVLGRPTQTNANSGHVPALHLLAYACERVGDSHSADSALQRAALLLEQASDEYVTPSRVPRRFIHIALRAVVSCWCGGPPLSR